MRVEREVCFMQGHYIDAVPYTGLESQPHTATAADPAPDGSRLAARGGCLHHCGWVQHGWVHPAGCAAIGRHLSPVCSTGPRETLSLLR